MRFSFTSAASKEEPVALHRPSEPTGVQEDLLLYRDVSPSTCKRIYCLCQSSCPNERFSSHKDAKGLMPEFLTSRHSINTYCLYIDMLNI